MGRRAKGNRQKVLLPFPIRNDTEILPHLLYSILWCSDKEKAQHVELSEVENSYFSGSS